MGDRKHPNHGVSRKEILEEEERILREAYRTKCKTCGGLGYVSEAYSMRPHPCPECYSEK